MTFNKLHYDPNLAIQPIAEAHVLYVYVIKICV